MQLHHFMFTSNVQGFHFLHIAGNILFLLQPVRASHVHVAHISTLMLHLYIDVEPGYLEMFVQVIFFLCFLQKIIVKELIFLPSSLNN